MKSILFTSAFLIIMADAHTSSAQTNHFCSSNKNLVKTAITAVNMKAFRHFSHLHKDVANVRWFKTDTGFVAIFMANGKEMRSVYDDNGEWIYNLHSYSKDKLVFDIRKLVLAQIKGIYKN